MPFIELGLIFYKIKDHKWWRHFYRTKLLRILAVDRLHELSVRSKVYLLHGIQSLTLSANDSCEKLVLGIIANTKGDSLSELKSLADAKGDMYNMHKLVYQDIRHGETQKKILAHIKNQAEFLNSHYILKSKHAMKSISQHAWRKIISDVDDTLACSGGAGHALGLAGIDTSYPAKTVYPGVIAFYRELDLGTTGGDTWDDTKVGNLVFLSARPHVYKDATEAVSYEKFRNLPLHTMPTLLAGALDTGFKFAYEGDSEPLAVTKFKNLQEYLSLYPEYKVIFLGDNGQGDVRTAEMALSSPSYRNNIHRVYVHLVQPALLTHRGASQSEEEKLASSAATSEQSDALIAEDRRSRQRNEQEKMCFFITYIDAALDAHARGLIRTSGLRNIMSEAVKDFNAIKTEKWASDEEKLVAARGGGGLTGGQGAGGRVIESVGQHYKRQARLPSTGSTARDVRASVAPSTAAPAVSSVWACYGESKRETRMRELNLALQKGNGVLQSLGFPPVQLFDRKFIVGSRARTEYGVGVITRIRHNPVKPCHGTSPLEGNSAISSRVYFGATYEILMQWDSTGCARPIKMFLQDWSIVTMPVVQLQSQPTMYFRTGSRANRKTTLLLPSAVNLPSIAADKKERIDSLLPAATTKKPTSGLTNQTPGKTAPAIGILTRESVAALPTATPLVPLYEKGEGSASSSTRSQSIKERTGSVQLEPLLEENVPPLEIVMQTSVFKPSVLDRARTIFVGRNRARSSSKHSFSSDDDRQSQTSGATGQKNTSLVVGTDRDISSFVGAQAWTPYGLAEIIGYDESGRDIVSLRMHGPCGYVDMFLHRSNVVQLTDPLHTRCFPDEAVWHGDASAAPVPPTVAASATPPCPAENATSKDDKEDSQDIEVTTAQQTRTTRSFVSSWFSSGIAATGRVLQHSASAPPRVSTETSDDAKE